MYVLYFNTTPIYILLNENCPGVQSSIPSPFKFGHALPGRQSIHDVAPALEYVPGEQSMGALILLEKNFVVIPIN